MAAYHKGRYRKRTKKKLINGESLLHRCVRYIEDNAGSLDPVGSCCVYTGRIPVRGIWHDKFPVHAFLTVRVVPACVCHKREIDNTGPFDMCPFDILEDLDILNS